MITNTILWVPYYNYSRIDPPKSYSNYKGPYIRLYLRGRVEKAWWLSEEETPGPGLALGGALGRLTPLMPSG